MLGQAFECAAPAVAAEQRAVVGVETVNIIIVRIRRQAEFESIPPLVGAQRNAGERAESALANLPDLGSPDIVGQIIEAQPGLFTSANLAVHHLVLPHPEQLAI